MHKFLPSPLSLDYVDTTQQDIDIKKKQKPKKRKTVHKHLLIKNILLEEDTSKLTERQKILKSKFDNKMEDMDDLSLMMLGIDIIPYNINNKMRMNKNKKGKLKENIENDIEGKVKNENNMEDEYKNNIENNMEDECKRNLIIKVREKRKASLGIINVKNVNLEGRKIHNNKEIKQTSETASHSSEKISLRTNEPKNDVKKRINANHTKKVNRNNNKRTSRSVNNKMNIRLNLTKELYTIRVRRPDESCKLRIPSITRIRLKIETRIVLYKEQKEIDFYMFERPIKEIFMKYSTYEFIRRLLRREAMRQIFARSCLRKRKQEYECIDKRMKYGKYSPQYTDTRTLREEDDKCDLKYKSEINLKKVKMEYEKRPQMCNERAKCSREVIVGCQDIVEENQIRKLEEVNSLPESMNKSSQSQDNRDSRCQSVVEGEICTHNNRRGDKKNKRCIYKAAVFITLLQRMNMKKSIYYIGLLKKAVKHKGCVCSLDDEISYFIYSNKDR